MLATIRAMRPEDLKTVLDLWLQLLENGYRADSRFAPASDAREQMRRAAPDAWFPSEPFPRVLVAEDEGRLVGFLHSFPYTTPLLRLGPTVRFADLWVEPHARRRGLGRRLVETLMDLARPAGFESFEVGTLVADERALAFWRGLGFLDWQVTLRKQAITHVG